MIESSIQTAIRLALGRMRSIRLFRHNVGEAWQGKSTKITRAGLVHVQPGDVVISRARRINFGLMVGGGDLLGWETLTITSDMVGQPIARFVSCEVKRPGEQPRDDQIKWAENVRSAGGRAVVVHSVEEARDAFGL